MNPVEVRGGVELWRDAQSCVLPICSSVLVGVCLVVCVVWIFCVSIDYDVMKGRHNSPAMTQHRHN